MPNFQLEIKTLKGWRWEAACKIRGEIDAPKYHDYILPLIFIKRLSDRYDDEFASLVQEMGDGTSARQAVQAEPSLVRFCIPEPAKWDSIARQSIRVGQYLTAAVQAIARENPKLQRVIDIADFKATAAGQRVISDDKLKLLIDVLGRYRLGLKDGEPDILARAYEYLLRKFAEGLGQSAGEFYTPREVVILMAHLLDPAPGQQVYDPCCSSIFGVVVTKCRSCSASCETSCSGTG